MTGTSRHFSNPVLPGFHPDPSICRVGDTFYMVTSSFEYFPGIPIFTSRDLVSWQPLGHCLNRTSQLDLRHAPSSGGIYAPTIRWHDGTFFATSTNVSGNGHFIVHTTDPAGSWSEPVWINQNGIDPSLFFEGDSVYFQSNVEPNPAGAHMLKPGFTRGIQQSVIDPFTGRVIEEPRFLWAGTGGSYPEAPHIFRRGQFYYLLISEGGTEYGHMATIARSPSVWGPWEGAPRNPILSHRSVPSPIQATGHADFVELADGSWWAVFLGIRPIGNWHHLGRETFLAPVAWDEEGWPSVGDNGHVSLDYERPLAAVQVYPDPSSDTFESPALAAHWQSLRTPASDFATITTPGHLTLNGRHASTDDRDLAFLGRRQEHFVFEASAGLHYSRTLDNGLSAPHAPQGGPGSTTPCRTAEAGLIVRMDEQHHYDLAVQAHDDGRTVILRRRVGYLMDESEPLHIAGGDLVLRVVGDETGYVFFVDLPHQPALTVGRADARYLSSEVAGGFTGVFIGLYAVGAQTTATWDYFRYSNTPNVPPPNRPRDP